MGGMNTSMCLMCGRTRGSVWVLRSRGQFAEACELPALLAAHVDPLMRMWARHLARGPDDMRVGSVAHAHV